MCPRFLHHALPPPPEYALHEDKAHLWILNENPPQKAQETHTPCSWTQRLTSVKNSSPQQLMNGFGSIPIKLWVCTFVDQLILKFRWTTKKREEPWSMWRGARWEHTHDPTPPATRSEQTVCAGERMAHALHDAIKEPKVWLTQWRPWG